MKANNMLEMMEEWTSLQEYLETAVHDILKRIQEVVENSGEKIDLDRDVGFPPTYQDWDIAGMEFTGDALKVDMEYSEPYEDLDEYTTIWVSPGWWEMTDEELLKEVGDIARFNIKERELRDIRSMKMFAEEYGYTVKKELE